MVNGETYILGTEDRDLPHEAGPTCPYLHDFCLGCHSTIPGQWGVHTKIDNGWILNFFFFLKTKRGDHIRGGGGGEKEEKKRRQREERRKNREKRKERKTGRQFLFSTGFQN